MASKTQPQVTLGQTLWMVPLGRSRPCPGPVTVTKVGRKWVTLDNGFSRFEMPRSAPPWPLDGGGYSSPGQVFLSPAQHEAAVARCQAWSGLLSKIRDQYSPPKGVATDRIEAITRELFPEVNDGK